MLTLKSFKFIQKSLPLQYKPTGLKFESERKQSNNICPKSAKLHRQPTSFHNMQLVTSLKPEILCIESFTFKLEEP